MDAHPIAWRLEFRDYADHRLGRPPPPRRCLRFRHRADADAELHRLRAMPGAEIVGAVAPIPPKPEAWQDDFGFSTGGPPRMTP